MREYSCLRDISSSTRSRSSAVKYQWVFCQSRPEELRERIAAPQAHADAVGLRQHRDGARHVLSVGDSHVARKDSGIGPWPPADSRQIRVLDSAAFQRGNSMASSYTASDIEVLSGLDPVRRRPGMYTDTTRPNHLAHEVIDNSVDEALAGYCDTHRRHLVQGRLAARSRTTAAACRSTSIRRRRSAASS